MRPQCTTHHSLDELRTTLRRLAHRAGIEPDLRSRLVLSASRLAAGELAAGRPVSLEVLPSPRVEAASLTVRLRLPGADAPPPLAGLPLPALEAPPAGAAWTVPLPGPVDAEPAGSAGGAPPDPVALLEEEAAVLMERLDALTREHRRLKDELSETNSGVLALYVQLEERDEQLRKAHGRMLHQLEDALRPPPVRAPGLELAVRYEPAESHAPTGGDLYDWFRLPDGTVHITLVDALGHGLASTRSALNVTHAVRTLALEGHDLRTLVARAAETLADFDHELMATVQVVRIDPQTGDLRLANGSHPPALLVRRDGDTHFLEAAGRGVGFPLPGSEAVAEDRLDPGDLLLLYTDGLTESRRDPREGERRLTEAARRHRSRPIEEVPVAIAEEMHTLILHSDDTVALAVRRRDDAAVNG
ncbi:MULTISPECIES: PP2C family protein-serine/threonine phosphatase [Streptomyces]|uniref:Translation initiation factor IF-2 n=2 Tax=Streptomyces TaxID=1883 RepID=A0A100Y8J9_9ACTN|nr:MULTISPECIES: PP2C family protein-serine/threonine phosphatase [Streptomyces]KUH39671.1 translation initiation factor IF-2 [Streptomyces kanasensis]UUS30098.1 SpoIIE family protein phosphatase [Streptomyces changanensis]